MNPYVTTTTVINVITVCVASVTAAIGRRRGGVA